MKVNEAIIDVEIAMAEYNNKDYYVGWMPILGCPGCNKRSMEYVGD